MDVNFYNMIFVEDNFLPFYRKGIPVIIKDKHVCINGLGRQRIFKKPEKIESDVKLEEVFKNYLPSEPWIGEEKDKFYLYRAQINEEHLDFENCKDNFTYLQVTAKESDDITVLNGKIFFKNFINGEQVALIKFLENTMLTIEKDEGMIMVEIVDGKFVCR